VGWGGGGGGGGGGDGGGWGCLGEVFLVWWLEEGVNPLFSHITVGLDKESLLGDSHLPCLYPTREFGAKYAAGRERKTPFRP